jgi:hypothetical protein
MAEQLRVSSIAFQAILFPLWIVLLIASITTFILRYQAEVRRLGRLSPKTSLLRVAVGFCILLAVTFIAIDVDTGGVDGRISRAFGTTSGLGIAMCSALSVVISICMFWVQMVRTQVPDSPKSSGPSLPHKIAAGLIVCVWLFMVGVFVAGTPGTFPHPFLLSLTFILFERLDSTVRVLSIVWAPLYVIIAIGVSVTAVVVGVQFFNRLREGSRFERKNNVYSQSETLNNGCCFCCFRRSKISKMDTMMMKTAGSLLGLLVAFTVLIVNFSLAFVRAISPMMAFFLYNLVCQLGVSVTLILVFVAPSTGRSKSDTEAAVSLETSAESNSKS